MALRQPDGHELRVAIVGGGASGTLTAMQLLHSAASRGAGLGITLVDEHARHGLGAAYSTRHDSHLLNAMAGQMSASPDDPGHLVRWANTAGRGFLSAADPPVTDTTFLPRPVYGRYLIDVLAAAERQAGPASQLTRRTGEVVAIRRNDTGPAMRVVLADGELAADVVVLAVGNAPAALPFPAPDSPRVVTDPWSPGALTGLLSGAGAGSVVIVGTGLTMLDLAIAMSAASPETVVHAVSRHGLLPRNHPGTPPRANRSLWLPVISRTAGPVRLPELMWQVRAAIAANRANWPDVMCSLRPFTPGLWRRMPAADQRLFLRHLARYWEVHRHLAPPATASRIAALRLTGRLMVHQGQVRSVTPDGDRFQVVVDSGQEAVELPADWLVNSTGTTADITATASPLLRDAFRTGLARPDPLRLGIDASTEGAVLDADGVPSDVLFTLGPPLRGLWYETTAIPEIRDQAAALARLITSRTRSGERRPGSAA